MNNNNQDDHTKKPHILFLGHPGFPVGFGAIQRTLLIAKGVVAHGCKATVISSKGIHSEKHDFPPEGTVEDIHYLYTSGTIHRPPGFWRRNWLKVVGKWRELLYIRQLKKSGELGGCLVSTMDFDVLVSYWLWYKLMGIPLILNYDEFNSAISSRKGRKKRINDYLFDNFAARLASKITPISNYLIEHVHAIAPEKPILKLPILCDFEKFGPPAEKENGEIRFVYCGAASYLPLIRFVMKAFELLEPRSHNVRLDLILGGSEEELKKVDEIAAQFSKNGQCRIHPNMPHQLIPQHYAGASALLIPLRPTVQDAARFPHKLGEYLASGNPVITTAYGEIHYYDFTDGQTALVAESYDPLAFSRKMQFVLEQPQEARLIGSRGREMGLKNFNYKDIGLQVKNFILAG